MNTTEYQIPKSHWAAISELGFIGGMRFLLWVYRIFGKYPFRICLYPVIFWYVCFKQEARNASRQYLQRIQSVGNMPKTLSVFRHFFHFADTILDKLLLWGDGLELNNIHCVGQQPVLDVIRKKQGCLLICSHFGNMELCRMLSRNHPELKLTLLVHTIHAKKFNHLLKTINADSQMDFMQVTHISPATAIALQHKIAQGGIVAIAGDRIPVSEHPRVALAPFLGDEAAFPVGPYILGSLLQCPIYLLFSFKADDSYEVYIEPFCERIMLPRKHRDHILAQLATRYASRLQYYCLKTPFQWFNFYNFWDKPDTIGNKYDVKYPAQ